MDKEKIRLINGNVYEIDSVMNIFNLLEITFCENINIDDILSDLNTFAAIELLTRGDTVYAVYENYNTVYKRDGQTVTLSNDGSVYVEPTIMPELPYEPYVPTLEDVKNMKINEFSSLCESNIEYGVDIEINGVLEHFSYKTEDQTNIKDAFDLAVQTGMDIPYHCDNGSCKLYTAEQIINLYMLEKMNLTHHTTYFNQMKMYITELEDADAINNLMYGQALEGKYLESYNVAMDQAKLVVQALLAGKEV